MSETREWLCRDCLAGWRGSSDPPRCPECGSPRPVGHAELDILTIAHIDCDAFYCTVEKRDDPSLADKPVIVGGGKRGVVSAACYVARLYGVRSAMPMFKALKACPEAVVIRPNMDKYAAVGRQVRDLMRETTPMVEPISIDEAFLDLSGTERLHHGSAARSLAKLVLDIEREIKVTASVGLSYNKFLAKVASDLDKPRGFAVIGRSEAAEFLKPRPVSVIWGVGKSLQAKMRRDGLLTVGQLQQIDEDRLRERYGSMGSRLYHFSRGHDTRRVSPHSALKSVSNETTLREDLSTADPLAKIMWRLSEKVSNRLKNKALSGRTVHLKLKTSDFRLITRSRTLSAPTQMAETLYQAALPMLRDQCDGRRFRLIGIGVSELAGETEADPPDLADPDQQKRLQVERAMDAVRSRLGDDAITKGRAL